MNAKSVLHLLLAGFLVTQPRLLAQAEPRRILPDDPAKAWAEVERGQQVLKVPGAWQTQAPTAEQVAEFQELVRQTAASSADKAREFIERFPTDESVGHARIMVVHALGQAVAAGDAEAEKQIATFVSAVLADKKIPEDDRAGVLLYSGIAAFMKKVGMRLFTEGMRNLNDELETAHVEDMRAALEQFPKNAMIYTMLLGLAERSTGDRQKELATEIADAPDAPTVAKTRAKQILTGTKPYQIGKPVDIRFTALDGRAVDLAKLTGKVVLVQFWSTTCGPCIGEMPTVKAAYEKFHPRGFEVVAISLDDKENALRRFIKEKDLPWPQHFDGNGWGNQFAVQFDISSIPTKWLVDKRGNLRTTDAPFDLERRVASLLDEQTAAPK